MLTFPIQQCLHTPDRQAHMVQLYRNAEMLAEIVFEYVSAGTAYGDGVVMIVNRDHLPLFKEVIQRNGRCLDAYVKNGQLVLLDAHETLAAVCENELPNWQLVTRHIGKIIDAMKDRFFHVRVYGEMVDILWQKQNADTAARLEVLWNRLVKTYDFSLLCGYQIDDTDPSAYAGPLHVICESSSHLLDSPFGPGLDHAVDKALDKVLGQTVARQNRDLAMTEPPYIKMNKGQAKLFFLADYMPNVTSRILQELRAA